MERYVSALFFLLLLWCNQSYGQAHDFLKKWFKESARHRIENRLTKDPVYESGDTLYLFYDPLDSLQNLHPRSSVMEWKLRDVSSKKDWVKYKEAARCFKLFEVRGNLTLKDLEGIVLTSRQELGDFYQRVYERSDGMEKSYAGERKMSFYFWDVGNHFACIYVFVVQDDGMISQYKTSLWGLTDIVM